MVAWLQQWIWSNRRKSFLLIILFPLFLWVVTFAVFYYSSWNSYQEVIDKNWNITYVNSRDKSAAQSTWEFFAIFIPIMIIWLWIAFLYERKIIFSFAGAKPVTRKEAPKLYNIVENLCISRWLPTPKIWIIEEDGMNAFALWWNTSDSWICFTRWLVNSLNDREIQAVAGHELTHIINKDSLLMLVMVLYIGMITTVGQLLMNFNTSSSEDSWKGRNVLRLIWLAFLWLWYLCYPLIRLAVSRKREYLADAGSVLLTSDNQSMISALRKISSSPTVNITNSEMAAMFIENPLTHIKTLFQTHPSVEDRIKALQKY